MADAPKQLDLAERLETSGLGATLPLGSALSRRRGGTGFSVDTLAELQTELGRAAASGLAPLDAGTKVPAANLPTMVGATDVLPGTVGAVPAPAAGDQNKPLRGDGTFSSEFAASWLTTDAGDRVVQVVGFGDSDNGLYVAATGSGSRKARLGTRSSIDDDVDLVLETKGAGIVGHFGDPFENLVRRSFGYWAKGDVAELEAFGLSAATIESWDPAAGVPTPAAPLVFRDTVANYLQASTDDAVGSSCGFYSPTAWIDRGHSPTLYLVGRSAFINSRVWFALAQTDPVAGTDLVTAANAGVGLWVDYTIHAPARSLRLVTCSGPAINLSKTGIVSVDASGRLDRNDGGSWITDGVRVDDLVTIGGLGIPGNNGPRRVVSMTAGTGRRITFDNPLATEGVPVGAVTLTHPGQVEIDTGYTVTANERFVLRLRYIPDRFAWEFSRYNFTNRTWENDVESDGVAPVPPGVLLKLWWRMRSLDGSGRTTAIHSATVQRGA